MTPHSLARKAVKLGSFVIEFTLRDGPSFITPISAAWTLTDRSGNIINGRQDISLPPAEQMLIVLQGLDLDLEPEYISQARYVKVTGTVPDAMAGALPFVRQLVFEIEDTIDGITP